MKRAAVADTAARQHDLAAKWRINLTLISHTQPVGSGASLCAQLVVAAQKIWQLQVESRRHQRAHINAGIGTKQHAVGVEQPHTAVTSKAAQDVAGVLARDAIEHLATCIGLLKKHAVSSADGELLPVQHTVGAGGDLQVAARLVDNSAAVHHAQASGQHQRTNL